MKSKFNLKVFTKNRRFVPVVGSPNIAKLWIWNNEALEYRPPIRGGCYRARKYITVKGKRDRTDSVFDSLEDARRWQSQSEESIDILEGKQSEGPTLAQVVEKWKRSKFPGFTDTTRIAYEKMLGLYFEMLLDLKIRQITPLKVDEWLDFLKDKNGKAMQSVRRLKFDHELSLLSGILKYYESYVDDTDFRFPIKSRHRQDATARKADKAKPKDISLEEFWRFHQELEKGKHGKLMAALAVVQYFQALRVSEVAGIHWDDVILNAANPSASRLKIMRLVVWPRKKGVSSYVRAGFKNSDANQGEKNQPLFPESHAVLKLQYSKGAAGLVFQLDGVHLEYRQIQFAYDEAFKRAGLPYRGTHVMRHGGCQYVYNDVPDTAVAQQLLGNSTLQSTLVYAKRHKGALTQVAQDRWKDYEEEPTDFKGAG